MAELPPIAEAARRHDPDRFLCTLFAPPAKREAQWVLIAFNHEIARAREAATNPMAALIRLQWWRDAVEEARSGAPVRKHEVAEPLAAAIRAGALDPDDLLGMIDAREAETEEEMPSRGALLAYLRGTAGGYAVTSGRALGASPDSLPALQSLGAAYGMAGLLRSIPAMAMRGRSLLPADMLAERGLTPADAARDPRQKGIAAVAQALAAEGLGLLPPRRPGGAAALPGVLARRDLTRMARSGFDPAEPPRPRGLGDRLAMFWAGLRG
ncbi:phytoene/squalene synthase family protein [Pseudoroseomonas globiformis]|uniref:Phytoene/squalene synthase family protein n=1 Tax=Teichococcus globiformis TaxID=2307229 RepID=A0ABV7G0J7_9PROT